MRTLATEWASTPSGYFLTVLLSLGVTLSVWTLNRQVKTNKTHTKALEQVTRALDLLVASHDRTALLADRSAGSVRALELATALLKQRLDQHEIWAADNLRRVESEIDARVRTGNPRPTV